jgi:membrane-bound lytic murein transglycosylase B
MSAARFGRIQRATALVPLALLSAAATASLAGAGVQTVSAQGSSSSPASLPDGTTVPTEAIEAPASVSAPGVVAPGISGNRHDAVATASTSGIPSAALAAYQRAETVINAADKSCKLPWQLVAAIGRVESDHGRTAGNRLDDKGVARPGIYGPALNGRNHTTSIKDTDAGQLDADAKYDRAVGPMQFIPSTWSVVGVDADGDAQRNPQDVDDAALATAVYLCSGEDDLSSGPGQRAAVYRYNHSKSYVDLVLSIMNAYMDGDFTSVPNSTTSAGYLVPAPSGGGTSVGAHGPLGGPPAPSGNSGGGGSSSTGSGPSTPPATGGGDDDNTAAPTPPAPAPTPNPPASVPTPKLPPLPTPTSNPVDEVLTKVQAIAQCTTEGFIDNPLKSDDAFDKCVAGYTS